MQGDERGEAFGELVVASGDATELLDAAEEALDQIAVFVQVMIELSLDEAMTSRRNDSFNAGRREVFENGVRVVSLIRTERIRLQVQQ